ncbi:MAG: hypothetical protein Q7J25_12235 [Vicinamibacterales bacterium]|nr:hypothetical protein [Vicinamibacterales bacterium]
MADPTAESAAAVHDRLRLMLKREFGRTDMAELGSALTYELASVVASVSASRQTAHTAIDSFVQTMHEQIDAFGVGKPHP